MSIIWPVFFQWAPGCCHTIRL